jgi:peroxiredoxin
MGKGPTVGEAARDFQLPDSLGQMQTLETLTDEEGVLLIFFRGLW